MNGQRSGDGSVEGSYFALATAAIPDKFTDRHDLACHVFPVSYDLAAGLMLERYSNGFRVLCRELWQLRWQWLS